jgi:glucokinase
MFSAEWAIGVDLGGTKIDVAQVDASGKVHARLRMPTDVKNGPGAVEMQILNAVNDLCGKNFTSAPVGIGIGVAGQVESETGVVRFAPNLNWHDMPLLGNLKKALRISGVAINDVRAATWGEWLYGAGQNCRDMVCVFVGTGIGGGIVSGGQLLNGSSNTAGEIGHIIVDMNGPVCYCGNRGCLEAFAGGRAIGRRTREAITADPGSGEYLLKLSGGELNGITNKMVAEAARAGDALSMQIMDRMAEALIAGCASIVNSFNPSRLVLGGGVIEGFPELILRVEEGIKKRALPAAVAGLTVMPAQLKSDSGVVGAAAIAMQAFGKTIKNNRN